MKFRPDQRFSRWFIIISALIITGLILWNVSIFFDHLKKSERERMEIWASSLKALNEIPLHGDFSANTDLIGLISQKNTSIPIIVTDGKGTILNSLNISRFLIHMLRNHLISYSSDFISNIKLPLFRIRR